jgi:exopolysaccharide production protein ExoQ
MDKEITLGEERAATAAARGGRRPHLGHVLGAAALLAPTLSITVPLTLAAMLGLTALAAMAIGLRDGRLRAMVRPGPFALVLGGFLAWAAASILWSIDPDFSAERLVRLAILMAAGCVTIAAARVMDDEERAAFGRLLTAGMAIGLAFLVFERVTDGWVHKTAGQHFDDHNQVLNAFNRGATVFALFVWPLMVVLWRRSARDAGLLLAAILALLVTLSSSAALAGLLLGAAALLIAYWRPRAGLWLVGGAAIVYMLAAPLLHSHLLTPEVIRTEVRSPGSGPGLIPRSAYHRLLIWNFTAGRTLERALLGQGLDSFEQAMPLHPHNGVLQIWLETGVVGVLFACALAALALRGIRGGGLENAASLGLFATAFVIICVAYAMWQNWWLASLFYGAAFCIASRTPRGTLGPNTPVGVS